MITAMASATVAMPSGGKIFCATASAIKPFQRMLVWNTEEYCARRTRRDPMSSGDSAKVRAHIETTVNSSAAIIVSMERPEKSALKIVENSSVG